MNLEATAVPVFVARRDHSYVASNDVAIVLLQPLHFMCDRSANRLRRIGTLKSDLQRNLHRDLSLAATPQTTMRRAERSLAEVASTSGRQSRLMVKKISKLLLLLAFVVSLRRMLVSYFGLIDCLS